MTATLVIRPYRASDRVGVRAIFGMEEFARPGWMQVPGMSDYLADRMTHYLQYEPQSTFVAVLQGKIIGALIGTLDTVRMERLFTLHVLPALLGHLVSGAYGWPKWLIADWRTELRERHAASPQVDLKQYPAHAIIGIKPEWRRQGIGTAMMTRYANYLNDKGVPGFHMRVTSTQPGAIAFCRRLGLCELGARQWQCQTASGPVTVTEIAFGLNLQETMANPELEI